MYINSVILGTQLHICLCIKY